MWVITVHSGMGSMVEGANPRLVFSAPTEADAKAIEDLLNKYIRRHPDVMIRNEFWAQRYEIPTFQTVVAVTLEFDAWYTGMYGDGK